MRSLLQLSLFVTALSSLHATVDAQATLSVDTQALSVIDGGSQEFELTSSAAMAGSPYLILGSTSGSSPGQFFGGLPIPLNADAYFNFTLSAAGGSVLPGSLGVLDATGSASAALNLPSGLSANLVGVQLTHSALIFDAGSGLFLGATNTTSASLVSQALSIETPIDGSTVGSPSVDVSGLVGDLLSGTAGLSVLVGGTAAEILPGEGGASDSYVLPNLAIPAGTSTLEVFASNAAGAFERRELSLTRVTLNANNVVVANGRAYAALGAPGYAIVDLATRTFSVMPEPAGSGSVDDLAIADGLLFLLDADGAGRLSVLDLADPDQPSLVSGPVAVQVSPFAGVSAAGGRVVVSGGTSLLQVRTYAPDGMLGAAVSTIDLGTGQPDVLLTSDGSQALVSTDFAFPFPQGQSFGITLLALADPPASPSVQARTGLAGAGFTPGTSAPANFAIESALLPGDRFLSAHGGGLSRLSTTTGALLETTGLPFSATNVDSVGSTAFVVGADSVAEVDYSGAPSLVSVMSFPGPGTFTGVAADADYLVIAANAGGLRVLSR